MASVCADDDPQASEYAGKDSPDDSDNDEGLYVEINANVTKLLTTQGTHDLDTMKHMLHTMRVQYEAGSLTKEECDRFASFVESSLDVLAHISEGATDTAPVEVQEIKCAEGSSSACPLVVEDGNRKTLMLKSHRRLDRTPQRARPINSRASVSSKKNAPFFVVVVVLVSTSLVY